MKVLGVTVTFFSFVWRLKEYVSRRRNLLGAVIEGEVVSEIETGPQYNLIEETTNPRESRTVLERRKDDYNLKKSTNFWSTLGITRLWRRTRSEVLRIELLDPT